MKLLHFTFVALALGAASAGAFAHGDVDCPKRAKEEWRPHTELQDKLTKEGWTVRRMEKTATCYEVYAKTPDGKRVEAFFDPKTFERVEEK
ncbi:PepSY domain-containing protein [Derxia lacustris]|uniref:PepSY domain-containing protein n=1 Tax=Derxia lacustris TaxID=764842 RepID=UPI000A171B4F|nr:PepSY domain-containing protein [Derxia lacustris]